MITINASRDGSGVTLELPPAERKRWPNGRPRVFIATEAGERGLLLGNVISADQSFAAAAILTGTAKVRESLQFLDPVTGDRVLAVDLL
jgi:hypothetical protein